MYDGCTLYSHNANQTLSHQCNLDFMINTIFTPIDKKQLRLKIYSNDWINEMMNFIERFDRALSVECI